MLSYVNYVNFLPSTYLSFYFKILLIQSILSFFICAFYVNIYFLRWILTFDDITDLQAAQKKAAWSDVARRIAHEIKNPLASLRSAVGTMRVTKRDDQREKLLDVIDHDVRRLDRLRAVTADIAVAHVVHQDEQDVRRLLRGGGSRPQKHEQEEDG